MTKWDKFFDEKIKEIAKEKIIRDIGGGLPFKKGLAGYDKYFKDSDYKILDYNPKYNPDILGDIHNLPFENESVDAIICKQVLQCVANPNKATSEIYRVLKKAANALLRCPFYTVLRVMELVKIIIVLRKKESDIYLETLAPLRFVQ